MDAGISVCHAASMYAGEGKGTVAVRVWDRVRAILLALASGMQGCGRG